MKTMLRKFRITHIKKDTDDFVLSDGNGSLFRIPLADFTGKYPSNLRLKFQPAKLNVTYIYGTNIILAIRLNNTLIYWQPERNFPEWEEFFETYSNTDAEIELSIRHFDEKADILSWNLSHQELDVFRFREELLFRHYGKDIPNMISRLKIENNLIFAVKSMRNNHSRDKQKDLLLRYFKDYAGLPTDLPFFVEWCLEEMEILNKLYHQDLAKKISLSNLEKSQVMKHSSKLIPISISDEKIKEYVSSFK